MRAGKTLFLLCLCCSGWVLKLEGANSRVGRGTRLNDSLGSCKCGLRMLQREEESPSDVADTFMKKDAVQMLSCYSSRRDRTRRKKRVWYESRGGKPKRVCGERDRYGNKGVEGDITTGNRVEREREGGGESEMRGEKNNDCTATASRLYIYV